MANFEWRRPFLVLKGDVTMRSNGGSMPLYPNTNFSRGINRERIARHIAGIDTGITRIAW